MMKEIEERRSIRKYLDRTVDDQMILILLESARLAPSGGNAQPWHFIIVKNPEVKKRLAEVSNHQMWMCSAPVLIACVADMRARVEEDGIEVDELSPHFELKLIIRDISIAAEHLVLEATSQGLGTCWVSWFKQREVRPLLSIPDDKYLVSIITVGYPAEAPKARNRKGLEGMIHYDTW